MALKNYFGKSGTLAFAVTTNAAQVVVMFYGRNNPELVYAQFSYPERGEGWELLEKTDTGYFGIMREEATSTVMEDELMIVVKGWNADGSQNRIVRSRILPLAQHPAELVEFKNQ